MSYFHSLWPRTVPLLLSAALLGCSPDGGQKGTADAAMEHNKEQINQADVTQKQEDDAAFLVKLAGNTLLQVELGKLAQARGSTAVVRDFGTRLVQHSLELLQSVRSLAANKSLALPAALSEDEQAAYHEVSIQHGSKLDQELMNLVIKVQEQDEDALDDMSEDAYDGDIRGLAAKYLPPVSEQLGVAKEIADEMETLP